MNSLRHYHEQEMSVRYPTWKKYMVISQVINNLRVRDKRLLFQRMRNEEGITHNTLFPEYGFTAGEFATWHVLSDTCRRKKS